MFQRRNNSISDILFLAFPLIYFISFYSCTYKKAAPDYKGFPNEIGNIIVNKCATSGCHNAKSKDASGGISLESWEALFEGSRNGSVVIPYRSDFSSLFFFTNTFSDLGVVLSPTMPYGTSPLSKADIITLKNWIDNGAPNSNGKIAFSNALNQEKYYVSNQACDVVTVFDAESGLPMRYVNVGNTSGVEASHMIKVSPDGQYWYVVFTAGSIVQKFRTIDDSWVGNIDVGAGNWNTIAIAADSKTAFCVDWSANGKVYYLDLENLTVLSKYQGTALFSYPHGVALNSTTQTLYVTAQTGNFIYKIDVSDPLSPIINQLSLNGNPISSVSSLDPHEIAISPDASTYFVTCQKTNEIRVFNALNDSLIATIATGVYPQEMSFSNSTNYLFVSSPEDTIAFAGKRGCVSVIDYKQNTFIKNIFTGFQPHGLSVDETKKQVVVANRNVDPKGPAPHHPNACGNRNGYITFIDINTLELISDKKIEVSADPYSVAVKP